MTATTMGALYLLCCNSLKAKSRQTKQISVEIELHSWQHYRNTTTTYTTIRNVITISSVSSILLQQRHSQLSCLSTLASYAAERVGLQLKDLWIRITIAGASVAPNVVAIVIATASATSPLSIIACCWHCATRTMVRIQANRLGNNALPIIR